MNKKMPQIINIPIHWGGKVPNIGLIIMFIIHLILLVTHTHTFPFSCHVFNKNALPKK